MRQVCTFAPPPCYNGSDDICTNQKVFHAPQAVLSVEPAVLPRISVFKENRTVLLAEALEARGVPVSAARLPKSALATPRALCVWLRAAAPHAP